MAQARPAEDLVVVVARHEFVLPAAKVQLRIDEYAFTPGSR